MIIKEDPIPPFTRETARDIFHYGESFTVGILMGMHERIKSLVQMVEELKAENERLRQLVEFKE